MSALKRTAFWGGVLASALLLPRVAVEVFYWHDARRVTRVPEWLSHQVFWSLNEVYSPAESWHWLRTPHPLLNHMAPADVLEAGGEDQVLALIEQLTEARTAELPLVRRTYGRI